MNSKHRFLGLTVVAIASAAMQGCGPIERAVPTLQEQRAASKRKLDEQIAALPARDLGIESIPVTENSIGMKLALLPAGVFLMASPNSADWEDLFGRYVRHYRDRIAKPFHLGVHEVTQEEWITVMGTTPWKGVQNAPEGDRFPAVNLSWYDATAFCLALTERERAADRLEAGESYRLPTEAEWEYALLAGRATCYDVPSSPGDFRYFEHILGEPIGSGKEYTNLVGSHEANPWGLFDMHGNVYEWCADWYAKDSRVDSPDGDSQGPPDGDRRVLRGGAFGINGIPRCARPARAYIPSRRDSDLGLRVVRAIAPSQ